MPTDKSHDFREQNELASEEIGSSFINPRESNILSPEAKTYFVQGYQFAQSPMTVDRAEECFKKVIELHPKYTLAYFELGRMFYEWSHFQRAVEPLKQAIALNPSDFTAYMILGRNCGMGGMYEEAEKALRKAIELEPTSASAHFELGRLLLLASFYKTKRFPESLGHFQKALEYQPNHKAAAKKIGEILVLHLYNYGEALLFADEIEQNFPDTAKHIRFLVELNYR